MFSMNTTQTLPRNAVVMVRDTSIPAPAGYTQQTALNGRFIKGIATVATNPGTTGGAATHTHVSQGAHTHTTNSVAHTHTVATNSFSTPGPASQLGQSSTFSGSHTHQTVSTASQGTSTVASDGNHTHDSVSNDPEFKSVSFYKRTATVRSMTSKSLPRNIMFFNGKTTIPEGILEDTTYRGKHIKGDATAGTLGGSNTHTHSNATHLHSLDMAAHSHVPNSLTGTGVPNGDGGTPNNRTYTVNAHGHGMSSTSTGPKTSTAANSGSDAGHTHGALNNEPPFKTVMCIYINSVSMSKVGIPKNVMFVWVDTAASVPTPQYRLCDGNNGTSQDMLSRYPKGDATPGSTGGNTAITHAIDSANHSHTGASIAHSHNAPTGSSDQGGTSNGNSGVNPATAVAPHSHSITSVTGGSPVTITPVAGPSNHDHGSTANEPLFTTVGFVERVLVVVP